MQRLLIFGLWLTGMQAAYADNHSLQIQAPNGLPQPNIVVVLTPDEPVSTEATVNRQAIMDQIDKQFVPHILAVHRGSEVKFPNSDSIKHHVYSFSPAKQFELRLYRELDANPVLFDKSGIVEIGCNIHDWMLGYIYVSESPYFGKTDAQGNVVIDAPPGSYTISVWHPGLSKSDRERQQQLDTVATTQIITLQSPVIRDQNYDEGFDDY